MVCLNSNPGPWATVMDRALINSSSAVLIRAGCTRLGRIASRASDGMPTLKDDERGAPALPD